MDYKKIIFKIIHKITSEDLSSVDPKADFSEEVGFDSMELVSISSAIEKSLDIEFPLSVVECQSLEEFFKIIEQELKKNYDRT